MKKNNIQVDLAKGYDVMKNGKKIANYPGTPIGYEMAKALAADGKNRYIRYWGLKDLSAVG